ncbi:MAG: hypothetical protein EZS28_016339 [Streblomastix strix]|uniref:Uncharacterized protein n=1 Tax=Streblomastix strix TaxID=222440 RepID=A0A5J4VZM8_9EUKA|nr:MAG: hypothetical protein EZS28_016339 [Streblomastix strix]
MMSKKRSNSLIRKGAQNDGINQPNLIKAASNTLNAQQNVKSAKKYKPYPKNDIIQHPINRKIWMGDRKTIQNENRLNFISYGRCDINGIRQNGHIYYLCEAERPGEHCDFERRDVQEIDVHQASGHKWRQVDSILQFTFNPNGSDQEESSNDDQENEDIVEVQYTKAQEILLSWLAIHGIAFLAIEDPLFDQYNEEINASKTTTQIGLNLLTSVLQKLFGTETTLAIDTGTKSGNTYAALTPNNPTIQPNCVILHIVEGIATGEQVGQLIANTINELKPYHIKLISLISDSARSLLSALRWDETNINSFIHFLEEFPEEGILHLKCLCHLLQRALVKSTEQNQDLMDYTSNLIAFSKLLQKKIYKIQFKQRCPKHQPQRWMYLVMLTLFVEVNQDQIRTVFPTTIPYLNISTEQFIYESLQLHRILHPTYILILRFEASYTSLSDVAPLLIQYFQRLSRITQLHKEQSWIEIVNCIANNVYALTFDNIDGPLYHLAYALTPMDLSSIPKLNVSLIT